MGSYCRALKSLNLGNNQISVISPLTVALKDHSSLQILVLGSNTISDVSLLKQVLTGNSTLKVLTLNNNVISDISSLLEALVDNSSLERLILYGNRLPTSLQRPFYSSEELFKAAKRRKDEFLRQDRSYVAQNSKVYVAEPALP